MCAVPRGSVFVAFDVRDGHKGSVRGNGLEEGSTILGNISPPGAASLPEPLNKSVCNI